VASSNTWTVGEGGFFTWDKPMMTWDKQLYSAAQQAWAKRNFRNGIKSTGATCFATSTQGMCDSTAAQYVRFDTPNRSPNGLPNYPELYMGLTSSPVSSMTIPKYAIRFTKAPSSCVVWDANGATKKWVCSPSPCHWTVPTSGCGYPGLSRRKYSVYENGVEVTSTAGLYVSGGSWWIQNRGSLPEDPQFKIEVKGGTITYSIDGTVFYTSTKTPTFPMEAAAYVSEPTNAGGGTNIPNIYLKIAYVAGESTL
jgi:hypothetical protein